jgi:hypothetical protein
VTLISCSVPANDSTSLPPTRCHLKVLVGHSNSFVGCLIDCTLCIILNHQSCCMLPRGPCGVHSTASPPFSSAKFRPQEQRHYRGYTVTLHFTLTTCSSGTLVGRLNENRTSIGLDKVTLDGNYSTRSWCLDDRERWWRVHFAIKSAANHER